MTDIIELMLSDHRRIRQQSQSFQELAGRENGAGADEALAATWDGLAALIELHLCAEQEICWLPMCGSGPWEREQIAAAAAAAADIAEAISAARLQPVGSWAWWRAVNAALSACAAQLGREESILAEFARHADRQARDRLGRQWLGFTAALRLDQATAGAGFAAGRSFR